MFKPELPLPTVEMQLELRPDARVYVK